MQGNCSEHDAAQVLGLTEAEAAGLLPLKSHQCLLIVGDTFLMSNGGSLLLENVYLKVIRSSVVKDMTLLAASHIAVRNGLAERDTGLFGPLSEQTTSYLSPADFFLVNITMQLETEAERSRPAVAVALNTKPSSLLMQGACSG